MPTNIARSAEAQIKKMGVRVVKGVKILSSTPTADGKTELKFSNDTKRVVDLYLPTTGGVVCNTEYVPKALLDGMGQVIVDDFLRVKNTQGIWAAGDVTNLEYAQIVYCEKQASAVARNLDAVLKRKEPVPYKTGGGRIMGLSLGRRKAVGRLGNMKIPSLIIWWISTLFSFPPQSSQNAHGMIEGRTHGAENLPRVVNGTAF